MESTLTTSEEGGGLGVEVDEHEGVLDCEVVEGDGDEDEVVW